LIFVRFCFDRSRSLCFDAIVFGAKLVRSNL
jgi:hypothetical protein